MSWVMAVFISIPRSLAEHARRLAEQLGLSLEEYIVELIVKELDPGSRAVEYINAAKELLEEAKKELEKGNIRQAAEKVWGAGALAVKAYAYWKEGKRLTSHRELWLYKDKLVDELGEWISDVWAHANSMHTCFYEAWCTRRDVEIALRQVGKLVEEIDARVKKS